jgi:hypothetical protein
MKEPHRKLLRFVDGRSVEGRLEVSTLRPEGPSFRPHGRLLPASRRSSGSFRRLSPVVIRLG